MTSSDVEMLGEARRRLPTQDNDLLRDIGERIAAARKAMDEARGNMPSSGPQNGSGGVCMTGGPTARIAVEHTEGRADLADVDEAKLDRLMIRMKAEVCRLQVDCTTTARAVVAILDVWAPLPAKAKKRDENLRAASDDLLNTVEHNHCQSHLRVGSVELARTEGSKLCRWCEDWTRWLNDPDGDWGNGVAGLDVDMLPEDMVRARVEGRKIDRHIPPRKRSRTRVDS